MSVESIYTGIKHVTSIFDDVYDRVQSVKNRKLSLENLTRAYYFEVVHNIELLNTVNFEVFDQVKPNSDIVRALISRIDIQLGATILFSEEEDLSSDFFKLLKSRGRVQNGMKNIYENILQAISFTVVKTELLKNLTDFGDDELGLLKNIQIDRRIINIQQRFKMIKKKLEELPAISPVAR